MMHGCVARREVWGVFIKAKIEMAHRGLLFHSIY
jgi:hypothetical protein